MFWGHVCRVKGFGFEFRDVQGPLWFQCLSFGLNAFFRPRTLDAPVLPLPSRLHCVCVKCVEDSAEWVVSKQPSKSRAPRAAGGFVGFRRGRSEPDTCLQMWCHEASIFSQNLSYVEAAALQLPK